MAGLSASSNTAVRPVGQPPRWDPQDQGAPLNASLYDGIAGYERAVKQLLEAYIAGFVDHGSEHLAAAAADQLRQLAGSAPVLLLSPLGARLRAQLLTQPRLRTELLQQVGCKVVPAAPPMTYADMPPAIDTDIASVHVSTLRLTVLQCVRNDTAVTVSCERQEQAAPAFCTLLKMLRKVRWSADCFISSSKTLITVVSPSRYSPPCAQQHLS